MNKEDFLKSLYLIFTLRWGLNYAFYNIFKKSFLFIETILIKVQE